MTLLIAHSALYVISNHYQNSEIILFHYFLSKQTYYTWNMVTDKMETIITPLLSPF